HWRRGDRIDKVNPMIDGETLDRQLREAVPYINDDGFTARVLARLPAARREPQWLRVMIVLGLALLGTGVAYLIGGGHIVREGIIEFANFPIWLLLVFAFGCGLVVGAFAVIFAIRKTPEVRDLTRLNF
ncbi:MAG TPA: hypothetical protein VN825_07910, partial [Candidatus Acidoferrum sp.]|nr:hypothetical protein [Candidatus Acidoferrum sp.]